MRALKSRDECLYYMVRTHEVNKVKEALAGYHILAGNPRS